MQSTFWFKNFFFFFSSSENSFFGGNDMAPIEPALNNSDYKLSEYKEVVRVYMGVEVILGYPLPTLQSHPLNCYPAPYTTLLH